MSGDGCPTCALLISEGLDLCVRARKLDAIDRRQSVLKWSSDAEAWQKDGTFDRYVERHNIETPHAPIEMRCLTPQLWAQDQYERDLADWEARGRKHLMQGCHL